MISKMRRRSWVVLAIVALNSNVLAGCAMQQYSTPEEAIKNACSAFGPKAMSGALIGGAAGAAGGAAIGATAGRGGRDAAIGALAGLAVGLLAGAAAGRNADQGDCQQAQIALQRIKATQVGERVTWNNSSTGSSGAYTAVSGERTVNGKVCREIRADYYIKNHQAVTGEPGLVCRSSGGDWGRVAMPG